MQLGHAAEKQAILRHGVVDARAGKNQPVVAAETRNQNGGRHQQSAGRPEHLRHHRRAHAVFRGVFDSPPQNRCRARRPVQRQRHQINKVAGNVERDHHARTQRQRQRQVAAGILYFARGERHVIPGVRGKQRTHLRHGQNRQRAHHHNRPAHSHLHGMLRAQSRVLPEMSAEVCGQRLCVSSQRQTEQCQSQQRRDFGHGKYILNQRSGLQSKDIHDRKKNHQQNRNQVLRIDSHIHVAQNHRPHMNRWNFPEMKNPVGRRNRGKENSQELAKSHAHSRNRSGLNHQKQSPAVEKSPQRPQRFAQINILPAGPRHHGGQFAIAERGHDGHKSRHRPRANQQRGRIHFAGNLRGNNKDAGADHRPDDQHGGAGQAQAFDQFLILRAMNFPVAAGSRCRCAQDSSNCSAGVPPAFPRALSRSNDFTSICGKIPLLIF